MIYGHEKTLGAIELFIINIGSATETKNITKFVSIFCLSQNVISYYSRFNSKNLHCNP